MNSLTWSQSVHTLLLKDDLQYKQISKLKLVRNPLLFNEGTESKWSVLFKLHLYEEFESPRLDADFSRHHNNIIDGESLLSKVNVM